MTFDLSQARWRKSSRSASTSSCVELAATNQASVVRDSKNTAGPVLVFDSVSFAGFMGQVKAGHFDR